MLCSLRIVVMMVVVMGWSVSILATRNISGIYQSRTAPYVSSCVFKQDAEKNAIEWMQQDYKPEDGWKIQVSSVVITHTRYITVIPN